MQRNEQKRRTVQRGTNDKFQEAWQRRTLHRIIAKNGRKGHKDYGEKIVRNESMTWQ